MTGNGSQQKENNNSENSNDLSLARSETGGIVLSSFEDRAGDGYDVTEHDDCRELDELLRNLASDDDLSLPPLPQLPPPRNPPLGDDQGDEYYNSSTSLAAAGHDYSATGNSRNQTPAVLEGIPSELDTDGSIAQSLAAVGLNRTLTDRYNEKGRGS